MGKMGNARSSQLSYFILHAVKNGTFHRNREVQARIEVTLIAYTSNCCQSQPRTV